VAAGPFCIFPLVCAVLTGEFLPPSFLPKSSFFDELRNRVLRIPEEIFRAYRVLSTSQGVSDTGISEE